MSIEAMKQALEALKKSRDRIVEQGGSGWKLHAQQCVNAITALREALAEQANEPDWKAEATALRVNEQNLIAALEAEREAIAQFFEQHYRDRWTDVEIVEAIRARSTT